MSTHNLCLWRNYRIDFYFVQNTVIKTQLFIIQSTGTGETAGPVQLPLDSIDIELSMVPGGLL